MMHLIKWLMGVAALLISSAVLLFSPLPPMQKFVIPLIVASFLALFRIMRGPTAADRAVASDVLGVLVIGVCGIFTVFTGISWYMDIAIAWALQSFIGILALAKYLEGNNFDD